MNSVWTALLIGSVLPLLLGRVIDSRTSSLVLFKRLALGLLTIAPAILLENEFSLFLRATEVPATLVQVIQAFFVYGFLEEVLRFCMIDYVVRQCRTADRLAVIFETIWVSLGFAIFENAVFIFSVPEQQSLALGIIRLLLPTAIHVYCGIIICTGLLKLWGPLSKLALFFAVMLHGSFDWLVLTQSRGENIGGLFLFVLFGFIPISLLIRQARLIDSQRKLRRG